MFGRGLRLFPGKEDCLVIDFEDNFMEKGKHSLITIPTLLGLNASEIVEDQDILALEEKAIQYQNAIALQEELELKEQGKILVFQSVYMSNIMIIERQETATLALDPDHVKIKVTEYDDLNELIADLSNSDTTRNASPFGWVDVGTNKSVLHVPTKGHLILEKSKGKLRVFGRIVA